MGLRTGGVMGVADFLPGLISIERGTVADYRALERYHYAPGSPATWAGVWRAAYCDLGLEDFGWNANPKSRIPNPKSRVVAVAVLSWPTPACAARERALRLRGPRYGSKLRFVNQHVRTISRVIVHPQFRGLGLGGELVRRVCEDCPTRYVEAIARMGEVHGFFEKGGMERREEGYFLYERERGSR